MGMSATRRVAQRSDTIQPTASAPAPSSSETSGMIGRLTPMPRLDSVSAARSGQGVARVGGSSTPNRVRRGRPGGPGAPVRR